MKKVIFLLLIGLQYIPFTTQAQPERIDSLLNLFRDTYHQSDDVDVKLKALQDLSGSYSSRNADSSLKYAIIGEELARQNEKKEMVLKFMVLRSVVFQQKGQTQKTLKLSKEVAQEAALLKDTAIMIMANGTAAISYKELNDYENAIKYSIKSIKLAEAMQHHRYASMTNNNLGDVYNQTGQYEEALTTYKRSREHAAKAKDIWEVAKTNDKIGSIHENKGHTDSALHYYEQAFPVFEDYKDFQSMAYTGQGIANILLQKGRKREAEKWYKKAIAAAETLNDKLVLFDIYTATAKAFVHIKPNAVDNYIRKAERVLPDSMSPTDAMSLASLKVVTDSAKGKYFSALLHQQEYTQLLEKWSQEVNKETTNKLRVAYEYRKEGAGDRFTEKRDSSSGSGKCYSGAAAKHRCRH